MSTNLGHNLQEEREKVAAFFSQFPKRTVAARSKLIPGGVEPRGVFYLETGHVRQFDISPKSGNEVTVHIFAPGSFFPLTWALNGIPNQYFFETVEESQVRVAPRAELISFLQREPAVLFSVTKRLVAGLHGLSNRITASTFVDARVHVLDLLLYLGRHFGEQTGKRVQLRHRFTHQGIADLIGGVRETVSVALERLEKQGFIKYEGKMIVIVDADSALAELRKYA